jgi:hypothetical protein
MRGSAWAAGILGTVLIVVVCFICVVEPAACIVFAGTYFTIKLWYFLEDIEE